MAKIQSTDLKNRLTVSKLLDEKKERRKQLAKLPIETKLRMVRQLRDASYQLRSAKKMTTVRKEPRS